jgi:hypothetical protein
LKNHEIHEPHENKGRDAVGKPATGFTCRVIQCGAPTPSYFVSFAYFVVPTAFPRIKTDLPLAAAPVPLFVRFAPFGGLFAGCEQVPDHDPIKSVSQISTQIHIDPRKYTIIHGNPRYFRRGGGGGFKISPNCRNDVSEDVTKDSVSPVLRIR